ncbi:MAG: N-6 DNA methylase [Candidatus Heimdallarchaeota archaeon]|nr:N-6 DNA methylase [Candidatus Heimdallarchaeota archaeon]
MTKVNDLNPKKWREYEKDNLEFTTVWDSPERDPYGWSIEGIKGNAPIEIPRQCVLRFSKEGEKVLDPFCGSGSTLLVCSRLKRHGIAIEINPEIKKIAEKNLSQQTLVPENNEWLKKQEIILGDSLKLLKSEFEPESFDLVFAHPPYWNLIKYYEEYSAENQQIEGDLSSLETLEEFNQKTTEIFKGVYRVLKPGRFFCVLIGEAFAKGGEVIPLDYYLTKIGLDINFEFYTKIIKITREATSRRNKMNIMKYRSLRSNFFICVHDYVLIFRKPDKE